MFRCAWTPYLILLIPRYLSHFLSGAVKSISLILTKGTFFKGRWYLVTGKEMQYIFLCMGICVQDKKIVARIEHASPILAMSSQ